MKTILLTGFSPFEGESINPTIRVIQEIDKMNFPKIKVVTRELPVVWGKAFDALEKYIHEIQPDSILALGQAGGRVAITPERVAINVDSFRIPDNEGNQPINELVNKNGAVAYWSTLPVQKMVDRMTHSNIPSVISNTAGTFVCNHIFYRLMDFLEKEGNIRTGGFMHIPYLPEQVIQKPGQPSMSLAMIVQGIAECIEVMK